jgi:hypothetical protein
MTIKAIEINSIEAKRFIKRNEKMSNVRIDNNSSVTRITEINNREAEIEFRYTASYGGAGVITIEGSLIWEGNAPELASTWASSNNMPPEQASAIHTAIMRVCVPEAVIVSRDLKLPPPLPLPKISITDPKQKRAQSSGMEVA